LQKFLQWVLVPGVWLIMLASPVLAGVVTPAPDDREVSLAPALEVLVDPEGNWSIDQVSSTFAGRFLPHTGGNPSFGFTRSVIWLRMTLDLDQVRGHDWYLVQRHPIVDHMHLYEPDGEGGFRVRHMGDVLPFGERELTVREFVFALPDTLHGPQTYYMKVHGLGALHLDLRLSSADGLVERTYREQLVTGLFFGAVLAMLLYNILLFITVRDTAYLYYLVFITFFTLSFLNINGLGLQYLWPGCPRLNEYFPSIIGLSMVGVIQYTRQFIGLRERSPSADRVLRYLLGGAVLLTLLMVAIPPPLSYHMIVFMVLVIISTLGVVSWRAWRAGFRAARLYVLAWCFFLVGCGVFALLNLGLLPHNVFTNYAPHFGGIWAILLLSLALGDRIKLLQSERDAITAQARTALEKHVQDVEQLDRDKLLFLEYLSHELNTPLNWLAGARLLQAGQLPPELADAVTMVQKGQDRLQQLVSTSLRYFDLAGREQAPSLSYCQPMWLVDRLLRQRDAVIRARSLKVRNSIPADLQVVACEAELTEVLGMLLDNAIQFSEAGGDVLVEAVVSGQQVVLKVRDGGRGIDPQDLERIFQPFFMIGSGHHADGFGLSLPMARVMIRHMGGQMWAESPGRGAGATACVQLPQAVF
jgi:two-component system, sensor histidine kinase LadS